MSRITRITQLLQESLSPTTLMIEDESSRHAGHAGVQPGVSETHLKIRIQADALAALSRVQQHQKIYGLLEPEFKQGLHALSLDVR